MTFPALAAFLPFTLLALRLLLALLFASSGWSHVTKPRERGESIGMSPTATWVLGAVELLGAASIALGLWTQLGAMLLIGVMLGAVAKKAFVWRTGFWGGDSQGWFYELLYIVALLVLVTSGGGEWTLLPVTDPS